jgi:polysaccharide export outer membrane protein
MLKRMSGWLMPAVIWSCLLLPPPLAAQTSPDDHNDPPPAQSSLAARTPAKTAVEAKSALEDASAYLIGPEDVLEVSVWKNPELTQSESVRPDGKIALKLVGEVPVAGMSIPSLRRILTEKYHDFVPTAEVSVTLKEMNSFKIYVLGRVVKPGEYKVRSSLTVLQALALCGGFTPYADEKKIKIIRHTGGQEQIISFNYRKVIDGKTGDVALEPGDRLLIP